MKQLLPFLMVLALAACKDKSSDNANMASTDPDNPPGLPYTASYSSHWSSNVSDADLKTVMDSYKTWETGDLKGLGATMADTIDVDMNSGVSMHVTRDSLMKIWGNYRDSLSAVKIDMETWHKMYTTDKKDEFVVVWYKEIDTYKDGRMDSAFYHDINMLKNGKIAWYSQYKRPIKK